MVSSYPPALQMGKRNLSILVFLVVSLSISMSTPQEAVEQPSFARYLLLVIPAILLPLRDFKGVLTVLLGRGLMLGVALVCAAAWHLYNGHTQVVLQLSLLVLVLAWVSSSRVRIIQSDLIRIYLFLIPVGFAFVHAGVNKWGLIPGATSAEFGIWRVSFFPNIAYSAMLSLALLFVLTRNRVAGRLQWGMVLLASYFLVFSFVRAAIVAAVMYLAFKYFLSRRKLGPGGLFVSSIVITIVAILLVAAAPTLLEAVKDIPLVSRLFLRGERGLSGDEIYQQLYRPWLWWEHVKMFISSPWLMGWGEYDFNQLKTTALVDGLNEGESVSLPTRLLAAYGLPGAIFTIYLVTCLYRSALRRDLWACACFPPVFFLMMNWGSAFHPTDAMFVIFVLMLTRGSDGFGDRARRVADNSRGLPEGSRA